jgi:hypothetical protein
MHNTLITIIYIKIIDPNTCFDPYEIIIREYIHQLIVYKTNI